MSMFGIIVKSLIFFLRILIQTRTKPSFTTSKTIYSRTILCKIMLASSPELSAYKNTEVFIKRFVVEQNRRRFLFRNFFPAVLSVAEFYPCNVSGKSCDFNAHHLDIWICKVWTLGGECARRYCLLRQFYSFELRKAVKNAKKQCFWVDIKLGCSIWNPYFVS